MDASDHQLLGEYAAQRSEDAFAELVGRHVDLVYSAARRMTSDEMSARDVTQAVFLELARNAARLAQHPVLCGWLHSTARNLALKSIRTENRRRAREQEAALMNEVADQEGEPPWKLVAPLLDEALATLNAPDRDALLLRYFERQTAREMAQSLGIGEEAAQKRVTRALDRLREALAIRGVTAGAGGLAAALSAHGVQAAPAGLSAVITSSATTVGAMLATSATGTTTQLLAMTTLQKSLGLVFVVLLAGTAFYQNRQAADLRQQNEALRQQNGALSSQVSGLVRERDDAGERVKALTNRLAALERQPTEVHQLRGQVGALRQEKDALGSKSALSKITADPESRKMMREQQKMGMSALYMDLVKKLGLSPEKTGRFNDLLADHVMESIDLITQVLHDKPEADAVQRMFAAQDTTLRERLGDVLDSEGLQQFEDHSKQLFANLTALQFSPQLTGDPEAVRAKRRQLEQLMQEETRSALASAGLPADYQPVPSLNLRNIASESLGDSALQLMDNIYAAAVKRAGAFLTPEELKAFEQFRTKAQESNRAMLSINRKIMAPIAP